MRKWQLLILVVAVMLSALAVVDAKQERRELIAKRESLRNAYDEVQIVFGQLQVELATFADYGRVEKMASESLAMRMPSVKEIRVVEP
jgi:cell division protein FtsL